MSEKRKEYHAELVIYHFMVFASVHFDNPETSASVNVASHYYVYC